MNKYAFYPFEFGFLKIGYNDKAIIEMATVAEIDADNETSPLADAAFAQVSEYLQGKRKAFDFPYEYQGTEFQRKVWDALCVIPYGETRTYKEIACAIGNPKACRAVGLANNRNPLAIVVPCHRVIGTNGALVGYASGLDVKQALLELEHKNCL